MIDTYKLKVWLFWPQTRAYLCTVAVAYSLNSVWRVPRDGFRYGGLAYGLLVTIAMVMVALPVVLLQLAVGQLSQQDAVGVWKAVPFFKGIGYLRLAISYLGSVCTIIYLAITATFFMFTLNNSIPFGECTELVESLGDEMNVTYASLCFNETIFSPVREKPEYYIALVLVVIFLWILFPFLLYNPVKSMKRIFYTLAPMLQVLWIVIVSCIGDSASLQLLSKSEDWTNLFSSKMWNTAIARALFTAQVAGGYLISTGDSIYSNSDVEWTSILFVGTNIITIWFGLITWFALGSNERDHSVFGPIAQTYNVSIDKNLSNVWPLLIFATLFLSGIISMICLLYPIYDRFRRVGGKWRYLSIGSSVIGSAIAAVVLVDHSTLTMLEDIVLPFLINFITAVEVAAFVFIYGWRVLLEDVEFLAGRKLMKFWVWGWCAAPGIIIPFLAWWFINSFIGDLVWSEPPWAPSALVATAMFTILVFIVFATLSVTRQVQYDILGKLITSFRPSRHWGPRDPIAHYYWLVRREELNNQAPQSRYHRRQLGQFSGASSFLSISKSQEDKSSTPVEVKRRSNSDDWLYSYRKDYLAEMFNVHYPSKRRSKSFDWAELHKTPKEIAYKEHRNTPSCDTTPSDSFVVIENSTTLPKPNLTSI